MEDRYRVGHRSLLFGFFFCALLAGCAPGGSAGEPTSANAHTEEKVLNLYAWSDFLGTDTIKDFEQKTGIKVHYDVYFTDDVLETKLLMGHSNYDLVAPSGAHLQRELAAGALQKLIRGRLPSWVNIDVPLLRTLASYDPNNEHAIPYLWSTTGIGYNRDKILARLQSPPLDSWSLLLDPKNAAKLADCGIAVIDSPEDVLGAALFYLGRDPNSDLTVDLDAAADVLMKIRPFVRYIDSSQYISDLATGGICAAVGWSGDIMNAKARVSESGTNIILRYSIPREGAFIVIDTMAIPIDAPHPNNAHAWLDYMLQPQVSAAITNNLKYANGNSASLPYVLESVRMRIPAKVIADSSSS